MRIIFHYLLYLLRARHRKGHGIHSPFVFDFVSNVLYGKDIHNYTAIRARQKDLLKNRNKVTVEDRGAGSRTRIGGEREVRHIVRTSGVKARYGRLLARIVSWHKPDLIIELGTGTGISSAYLASGNRGCTLYSVEGSESIRNIARETMIALSLDNVELIHGLFSDSLPILLDRIDNKKKFLVFIDGDHTGIRVLEYCDLILTRLTGEMVVILDDIYWSPSMTAAWEALQKRSEIAVSINLFQFGILFVKKGVQKQHYVIRF